jgi:hypothetical protein
MIYIFNFFQSLLTKTNLFVFDGHHVAVCGDHLHDEEPPQTLGVVLQAWQLWENIRMQKNDTVG